MKTKPAKYTPDFVLKELEGMLKEAKTNQEIIYLGSLFTDKDYSMDTFKTVIRRFVEKTRDKDKVQGLKESGDYNKIKQIVPLKKKIKEVLLSRIVEQAKSGKINPVYSMFLLKVLGKWVEAQHTLKVKHEGNVQVIMDNPQKTKGTQ